MVPGTRREICSSHANANNKRLKKECDEEHVDQNAMALLPHLPELIVAKIFQLIPTKLAVRSSVVSKQWASVWSLGVPFLDFDDEGDPSARRKLLFIDFVDSCLKHYERNKLKLDRFILRMRYDSELIDSTRIDKWFSFVVDQCVKELYVSIQRKHDSDSAEEESTYYRIPHTILNAQYLTFLHLQHVRITDETTDLLTLPLLITMTLNDVLFDCRMRSDRSLWKGCPSIKLLSLESCSFSSLGLGHISVNNSSIQFLKILDCKFRNIEVTAENLEYFFLASEYPQLQTLCLHSECVRLKFIAVHAPHSVMTSFTMPRKSQDNMKAVIYIPSLSVFHYHGYLLPNDLILVYAQRSLVAVLNLDVLQPNFLPPMIHFPTWRDFLQMFDCCNAVQIYIHHDAVAGALTFPELFRKIFRPPLLNTKLLGVSIVRLRCPQTMANSSALIHSLRWMAPHAEIRIGLR